jgi:hypothetical protein
MSPVPTTDRIAVLDLIELIEPFDGIPAGAAGGVLELNDDDTAMVEITSHPELDVTDRIVFPPLATLRLIGAASSRPSDVTA